MKRNLVSLYAAGTLLLAGASATAFADDVAIASRLALADCMVEAAVSAMAGVSTYLGACQAGSWTISVHVDEWEYAKIPIQGYLVVYNQDEFFELNGKMSARKGQSNDVLCEVQSQDIANVFSGVELVYAAGSGNFYPDALPADLLDRNLYVDDFVSAGAITIEVKPKVQLTEGNLLEFEEAEGVITASGWKNILDRKGEVVLSTWQQAWTQDAATFSTEVVTSSLGECKMEIEGNISTDPFFVALDGTVTIEAE